MKTRHCNSALVLVRVFRDGLGEKNTGMWVRCLAGAANEAGASEGASELELNEH